MRPIKAGSTDQTVYFKLIKTSDGTAQTGLVYNSSGLVAYYALNRGSSTQITLATLAAANSAHSDGGFKEVDSTGHPGLYRLDLPDAAVATGPGVVVTLSGFSGMKSESMEIELVAFDPYDSVRLGLTAMPNAAAGANGGLPLSVDTSGRVDVLKINGTSQTARDIGASVLLSSGTGTGQLDFTSGVVKSNLVQMGGVAQSATDLKDFADTGYDPATHKVQGVVLVDTTTTNTDMRGTDSAATAVNLATLQSTADDILTDTGTTIPATLSTIAGYIDTEVAAIKAKTDQLTFGVSGKVDSNITHVNETEVTGTGALGDEWGPV